MKEWTISTVPWHLASEDLQRLRREVFIVEQGVPVSEEWDDHDANAVHLLARDAQGAAIGTARVLDSGKITRMAVYRAQRRQGIGSALAKQALQILTERNCREAYLDAQVSAIEFYRKLGFVCTGEAFTDAGIRHQRMVKQLLKEDSDE